jgi:propionyl-CoA carboxylase alpha chain
MRPVRKLLVANRGEIARRVFRTCRDMGISTVAVFSDPDRDMPYVREADEAAPLPGALARETYLNGEALVEAARRTGADAVHPGYGFLAENAAFARRVGAAGLTFIGPPPEAIAAMGDKLAAKDLVRRAGVPVLAGEDAAGLSEGEVRAAAIRVGWPLVVKARSGGGGHGMRLVREPDELAEAVASARREAAAAFGDDAVFLERALEWARHVEVQIFGDMQGSVVSLFERECSVQRRHQKVLEECPSPAVDDRLRETLGAAAVAAARAAGYVGAGTVEFLLAGERAFFFLEMNTRLQVEHPVTEAVTGLDLVRLQIEVARGDPLPREAREASLGGHAIEARLYAEDPLLDFRPDSGRVHRFRPADGPGVRVDAGVEDGTVVSGYYDSLLAKVIAHAATREEAAERLAAALLRLDVHGVRTNRELLVGLLRHPEFRAGETDTGFLERHPPDELVAAVVGPEAERLHAMAAALAGAASRRAEAAVLRGLPSGWRNNPSQLQEVSFEGPSGRIDVAYGFARGELRLSVGGTDIAGARVGACTGERVDLEVDGVRRAYRVHRVDDVWYVDSALGHTALREIDRFPLPPDAAEAGSLRAPLPGRIVRIDARVGENVEAGATLAVLEAMKMEHRVSTPVAGRITAVRVREGEQVEAGAVLAVVDPNGG